MFYVLNSSGRVRAVLRDFTEAMEASRAYGDGAKVLAHDRQTVLAEVKKYPDIFRYDNGHAGTPKIVSNGWLRK